jgi:hypothetical protein
MYPSLVGVTLWEEQRPVMRAAAGRVLSYFDMFSELLPSEAILKAAIYVYSWCFPSGNVVLQDAVLHG